MEDLKLFLFSFELLMELKLLQMLLMKYIVVAVSHTYERELLRKYLETGSAAYEIRVIENLVGNETMGVAVLS